MVYRRPHRRRALGRLRGRHDARRLRARGRPHLQLQHDAAGAGCRGRLLDARLGRLRAPRAARRRCRLARVVRDRLRGARRADPHGRTAPRLRRALRHAHRRGERPRAGPDPTMTARAVRFPRAGDVVIDDIELASPGPGQLRCRALASLVSTGTELACLRGEFDQRTFWADWVRYPFSPGYSMVSRVEEVGAGVDGIRPGDRVFSFTPHASAFVIDAAEATALPAGVSDEQAVWSSLAVTTQWAVRRSGLVFGEVAVVVGAGLLGQLLVRYLR